MEEVVIPKDTKVEKYFKGLPYTIKDRLHRYRKVDEFSIDSWGRAHFPKQDDKRKGKIINNRCYRNLGEGSWELIAIKLPDGGIIGTDKEEFTKILKPAEYLLIDAEDEWENEKELERIEKLCREGEVKCLKDYKVLMKL
jgi:hypothetical protein